VAERSADGRLRIRDLRAQLVLRPHDPSRVLDGVPPHVHVVGWAGRDPVTGGSHAADAAAVAAAVLACTDSAQFGSGVGDWLATAEVESLLARFAGEGTRPLADYDRLLAEVDDD
jgi:hypothetical protein